jgi:hypothetical protein
MEFRIWTAKNPDDVVAMVKNGAAVCMWRKFRSYSLNAGSMSASRILISGSPAAAVPQHGSEGNVSTT